MEKILIIVNPSSGDEKGLNLVDSLEQIYENKGIKTTIYETKGKDNFKKIIKESMKKGYEKIVVLGGDGTISEVVNGIARLAKRPKIVLIPSGTTNNFGRMINSGKTEIEILEAIKSDQLTEQKVDVGRINDEYFISSIAVGLLPAVGWETDNAVKAKIGPLAYVIEGIKKMTATDQKTFDLQIKTDEQEKNIQDLLLFIVGLSNSIMGIETFFKDAKADDGKLHYFGLEQSSLTKEASGLIKQVLNATDRDSDSSIFTGSFERAELYSDSTFNFLIDGDKGQKFPVSLDILPGHLIFCIP